MSQRILVKKMSSDFVNILASIVAKYSLLFSDETDVLDCCLTVATGGLCPVSNFISPHFDLIVLDGLADLVGWLANSLTTKCWKLGRAADLKLLIDLADKLTLHSVLKIEGVMWPSDLNTSPVTFPSVSNFITVQLKLYLPVAQFHFLIC